MSEQQPPANPPANPPAPPADPKPPASEDGDQLADRFAVYDLTHQRFVGRVMDKRPSKADAAKMVAKGHDYEVRKV